MTSCFRLRGVVFIGIAIALSEGTAHALVRFNDGTDKIFVGGSFSIGHASNLSASAGGTGGYSYAAGASIEYQRHAGLITVDANVSFNLTNYFAKANHTYNALNPTYTVEFDKGTGRTTGALTLSAVRSSQADAAANVHDTSWNFAAGLNLKYPIIERWALTGSVNASYLDFTDSNQPTLQNLLTWGASLGTFYILSEERDLFATYRYRYQESTTTSYSNDNALMLGVSGKVIGEINGSLSVGGQVRTIHRRVAKGGTVDAVVATADGADVTAVTDTSAAATTPLTDGPYWDWTGAGALTWNFNKKLKFSGSLNKDFNTTSTDASTDSTSGTLTATYAYNAKWGLHGDVGGGMTRYLGPFGLLPDSTKERRDYNFNWSAGVSWAHSEQLHVDFTYNYLRNWSNLSFAEFISNNWTLSLSTHW